MRVARTDERKEKFGFLVDGRTGQTRGQANRTKRRRTGDGWSLTDAGVNWAEKNKVSFDSTGKITKDHRQKSMQVLSKLRRHDVFALYDDSPQEFYPSIGDLADLLRCRVDADDAGWMDRFERIRKYAVATGKCALIQFYEISSDAIRRVIYGPAVWYL